MNIITTVSLLRRPTEWVDGNDDIGEIVASLFAELKERDAFGLSANQLGYKKRIFVMTMKPYPPVCIVNPTDNEATR